MRSEFHQPGGPGDSMPSGGRGRGGGGSEGGACRHTAGRDLSGSHQLLGPCVRRERERETRQCVEPAQSYGIQCEEREGEGDKTVWSQHRATVYSVRRERERETRQCGASTELRYTV